MTTTGITEQRVSIDPNIERSWLVIEVPDECWEPSGDADETSRLTLKHFVVFAGVPMHVEAYAVEVIDDLQTGVGDWSEDTLNHLYGIYDPGEPFSTTRINDRDYVLVAYPHGD